MMIRDKFIELTTAVSVSKKITNALLLFYMSIRHKLTIIVIFKLSIA